MEKASVDDPDSSARTADVQAGLSDPLNLSDMAMNYYELAPGDSFSGGLHTHMNQEEIFYVIEGTATFQTPEDSIEVEADEAIRFAPGEYQEGKNEGDERVRALALGAPKDQGETRSALPCENCGADYHEVHMDGEGFTLVCPDCGNELEV
jgi:mannose-6-phosphate isomerase-like protein (cupin superfamily)